LFVEIICITNLINTRVVYILIILIDSLIIFGILYIAIFINSLLVVLSISFTGFPVLAIDDFILVSLSFGITIELILAFLYIVIKIFIASIFFIHALLVRSAGRWSCLCKKRMGNKHESRC